MLCCGFKLTEWTAVLGQVRNADIEVDACAVGVGAGDEGAVDSIAFGKDSDVLSTLWVILSDRCAASEDRRKTGEPEGSDGR